MNKIYTCSLIFLTSIFISCSSYKYSYTDIKSPVYTFDYRPSIDSLKAARTFNILSFNIEFANKIDEVLQFLKHDTVPNFDIILLQEMDENATERIAETLEMQYVYYPSIFHPGQKQNVGNSILSKWKIESHRKIISPHTSIYPSIKSFKNYRFIKIATEAIIHLGDSKLKAVSTHAAAFQTSKGRKEFSQSIVDSLKTGDQIPTIVGGDFNSFGMVDVRNTCQPFLKAQYKWATRQLGKTVSEKKHILKLFPDALFQLDHIFTKDVKTIKTQIFKTKNISDHNPIMITIELQEAE